MSQPGVAAPPGSETHPEEILRRVHPAMFRKHPFRFLLYLTLAVLGAAGAVFWWSTSGGDPLGAAAFAVLGLLGASLLGWWWIRVRCTTLIVTSKRIIYRTGIVSRRTSEVRHDDVRNLQMDQGALERIFGVGDIAISSAGQSGLEIVAEAIPDPDGVIRTIRERQR